MCIKIVPWSTAVLAVMWWRTILHHGISCNKVYIPGDIILGGLFPVHQKEPNSTRCGSINKDRGIQRLEAMLFAIDKINRDKTLLEKLTLGALILDTCASDTYALNQSLEFIRSSINTVDASAFVCEDDSSPRLKSNNKAITGVVGGSYSEVSLQVANLLRLFRIPQVSPASTGTTLSDKTRYDFFARTVPPDTFQAIALVDVVEQFNWSYVSLVTSEGQYGDSGMTAFQKEARARNICIAVSDKVPHSATPEHFDNIVEHLLQKSNARAVVLFARDKDAEGILRAVKRANAADNFTWIASDGWGKQKKLLEGLESVAEGAITVELESRVIEEFDHYMLNIHPSAKKANPWFREYWEAMFNCTLTSRGNDPFPSRRDAKPCKVNFHLRNSDYSQDSKVQFVVDAVYAFAHALDKAWRSKCKYKRKVYCEELKEMDGGEFYKNYLLNVSFIDMAGSQVEFDEQGDGLGRYTIYNYQQDPSTMEHDYKIVGHWYNGLNLSQDNVVWAKGQRTVPMSMCSLPCALGEVKVMQSGDVCCWICKTCDPWQFVLDEFTCKDCGFGRWPYPDKRGCYDLEERYIRWNSIFAIVPMVISGLGIALTLAVIATFFKHNDTPIVKAAGRELSYMLLTGILFCYLVTFVLLAKPSLIICALQRFGVGFGFSTMYSALLTKTNRISRIFESARISARRPGFISPKSQVIIAMILISLQVIATAVWFLVEPPGTRHYLPDGKRNEVILKCRMRDSSFLLSLIYNMVLITICTVYAVKTRKIPENFNESKFIGFTMYTTCIIWLAFVPLYFGTGNSFEVQITTLCISTSLSAYAALFCLFSPKIYIILFHAEKNVRKLTMNSAAYKRAPTSSTCGTSVNHAGPTTEHAKVTFQNAPTKDQATEMDEKDSLASL